MSDEDVKMRVGCLKVDPQTGKLYSSSMIDATAPAAKTEEEEDDDEEEDNGDDEEDEEKQVAKKKKEEQPRQPSYVCVGTWCIY